MTATLRTLTSCDDPLQDKAFSDWWNQVFAALDRKFEYCWEDGPMLEVLVEKYKEGLNPDQGADEALEAYEEMQLDAQMAIPIWDR